jgi:aminobenzoyl-glutamate utilization protein B
MRALSQLLRSLPAALLALLLAAPLAAQDLETLRPVADQGAAERAKLVQVMVDSIFSFGELGFQEFETSRYITDILRENGFEVEEGIAGIPTAWMARWGSGSPVIALGSDIDGIPKASQKPGVAYHDPLVEGAPGHGEGHNSGQAVIVVGALAAKEVMEREGISGTIVIWPGVAEELVGTKAWFIRDGYFEDVDICIFTHVSNRFGVSWGQGRGNGLVSVEYTFRGESAHSAGAPWRGRSALDAVEIMNMAWNVKREHLRLPHRSHYVITNGGDQPNVVPQLASVWYYFRELEQSGMKELFDLGNTMAQSAAAMTSTDVSWRILGHAYPRHFNKPVAEAVWANIERVGLPEWSEADQALANGLQRELGVEEQGLATELGEMGGPVQEPRLGGGSDDIGDISWAVPTVTMRFPSNIPGGPGHHWANAVAMATPIAHKGASAGARVIAMTLMDLFLNPELVPAAKEYFAEQTAEHQYTPLIGPDDPPGIHLNEARMNSFREAMRPLYYDPENYDSYLEQLGIEYPTVRPEAEEPQN